MSLFNNEDLKIEKIYQHALKILNFAPQTEQMLSIKLIKKGYSKNIIEEVIKKLKDENLINDVYYAKIYAESLVKNKYLGSNKLYLKLITKGINKDDANIIAKEATKNNGGEEKIIIKYIKKKSSTIKKLLEKNQTEKIKQKLYNNGFSIQTINNIVKDLPNFLKNSD